MRIFGIFRVFILVRIFVKFIDLMMIRVVLVERKVFFRRRKNEFSFFFVIFLNGVFKIVFLGLKSVRRKRNFLKLRRKVSFLRVFFFGWNVMMIVVKSRKK